MKADIWIRNYKIAEQYYMDNGNLLIPSKLISDDGIKIGIWISKQRKEYKENKISSEKIELLEKIGMVWSVYDIQWYEFYSLAVEYYNNHGDLLIPLKYITEDGKKLGYWISTQRRSYNDQKLLKNKIELLENIGMVWSVYDLQWNEYYDLLVEYYKKNGNVLVPLRYKSHNKNLGNWLSKQRCEYKENKISDEKIELLEKIGMEWDVLKATWEEMYKVAEEYYHENGNLSISNTRVYYKNVSIGSWILTQRYNYRKNLLSDEQIHRLNKIGMEWNSSKNKDYIWDENYNTVLNFYKKYKHLYIPISYVTEDGIHIGTWLYDQGLKYKTNKLTEYRKKKLDELDSTWLEPINTKSSFPEQAVLFYISNAFPSAKKYKTNDISEIDIFVPERRIGIEYDGPLHIRNKNNDIKKSKICKEHGIDLVRIRDMECPIINDDSHKIILKDKSFEALNEGIKELLRYLNVDEIDVDIKRDYLAISDNYIKSIDLDWYLIYDKLKEYYEEYGNINIPASYLTKDGIALGRWISNMRSSYNKPSFNGKRLNSNKIELLNVLGMDWNPVETQWNNMYILAKDYYLENGNLLIPSNYIANGDIKLGKWIGTQRYTYKEKKLSDEKILLLERIGMIWNVAEYQWYKMYTLAFEYYEKEGNLLIPNQYVTSDNIYLGAWLGKQRRQYKNKKLSNERIKLLDNIAMVWNLS